MRHHGLSAIGTLTKLAYALVPARLATSVISTPLFFVSLGLLAGPALGLVGLQPDSELLVRFLQAALGMMLFVDASSLDLRNVSLKAALAGRLLVIGLPLMVLAGGLVAVALWPGIALWQAALVGAMLAPTDDVLAHAAVAGAQAITDVVLATVSLSIVVHGVSAAWGARRYGEWFQRASHARAAMPEAADVSPHSLTPRQAPPGAVEPDTALSRS